MKFNINKYLINIMKTLGVDISTKRWKTILKSRELKCFCWQDYCNGRPGRVDKTYGVIIDTPTGGFMVDEEWCDKEELDNGF